MITKLLEPEQRIHGRLPRTVSSRGHFSLVDGIGAPQNIDSVEPKSAHMLAINTAL